MLCREGHIEWNNGYDHRAGTIDLQAEKSTRKPGFVCIVLLSRDFWGRSRASGMPVCRENDFTILVDPKAIEPVTTIDPSDKYLAIVYFTSRKI